MTFKKIMSMAYIRNFYGVSAKRGNRVIYKGGHGTITRSKNAYLWVRMDEVDISILVHPADKNLVYLVESKVKNFEIKTEAKDE